MKKSPTAQRAKQKENTKDPKQHGRENENLQERPIGCMNWLGND